MSIGSMEIIVPSIYEIRGVKKRCRKPTNIGIVGQFPTRIKTADPQDVIPAFTVECITIGKNIEHEIVLIDGKLYQQHPRLNAADLISDPAINAGPFDKPALHHSDAKWPGGDNSFRTFDVTDNALLQESNSTDFNLRTELYSNRNAIQAILDEQAGKLAIVGQTLYRRVGEPYYCISTTGMGGNHGHTIITMALSTLANTTPSTNQAFNANQLKDVQALAQKIAHERGNDGFSLLYNINVHNANFVTLPGYNPTKEDVSFST